MAPTRALSGYSPFGDIHWKQPVVNVSLLGTTGNLVGDARVSEDTFNIYIWNGSSWAVVPGSGGGSGDVTGPSSGVAYDIVTFSGTTGKVLQDSGSNLTSTALIIPGADFQMGTTDAFGHPQMTEAQNNIKMYLGSWSADNNTNGDQISEGVTVYGNSLHNPISFIDGGYARIKPDRFGLFTQDSTTGLDDYYWRVDSTHMFFNSDSDASTFDVQRSSGQTTVGSLIDVGLSGSTALISDNSKKVISSQTSATEIGYVHGVTSAIQTQIDSKQASGNYITALTGDVTASGPGSVASTLATVNSNVGSFGSSTSIPTITVTGKGLITAASGNAVVAPAGTLTGATLASGVTASSLTSVGTIGTGVWNGTTIAISNGGTGQTTANTALNALLPSQGSANGKMLQSDGTNTSWQTAGSGTVTSVTFTGDGTILSSTPSSAVTTSGTITGSLKTQNANLILAGPTSGSAANPTFRSLVSADFSTAGVIGSKAVINLGISCSISSNTLVCAVKQADGTTDTSAAAPAVVGFRSATATNGGYILTSFTAANSITLSATDSIGEIATGAFPLHIYLISDSTSEICLSRSHFSDDTLQSASALTGGADTDRSILWCTSAHTSRPVRKIGDVFVTWSNPNWGSLVSVAPFPRDNGCRHEDGSPDMCTEWFATSGTNCTAGNCTLTTNSPGISTVSFNSTGNYTINFGTTAFSVIPVCSVIFDGFFAPLTPSRTAWNFETDNVLGSAANMSSMQGQCSGYR